MLLPGSASTARRPPPVATSVMMIMRTMPNRSARKPQASLPAMPPTRMSGTDSTAQPSGRPFDIRTNAMKVSKPVRVLESRISIRHSAVNPCGLRMPQPAAFAAGSAGAVGIPLQPSLRAYR